MKKIILGFFFTVTLFASSWSLLRPGFFRVHDYVHATRIAELLRAVQDGQFPVRWSANLGYGYGMPLFEFYAPLPYYVGAVFYWLGVDVVTSIKLLYLLCSAATFWGMYFFAKRIFGRTGAVLAAVALTLAPYRAVNLFVRGSLSEAWGIMALPWVLLGIVQVIRREKNGWRTLVFGLVTLFLSHNITTMIFLPVSIVFAGVFLLMEHKFVWKKLIAPAAQLLFSYVLAVGLAAFYLFPAFLEKDFTKISSIFNGYFYYSHHFLYIRQFFQPNWKYGGSSWGPNDDISFFFGWGQLLGAALALVFLIRYIATALEKSRKNTVLARVQEIFTRRSIQLSLSFFTPFGVATYMTLQKSKPIWDAIPFFTVVQFPWRWLSIACVLLSLIVGSGMYFIKRKFLRFMYAYLLIVVMLVGNFFFFRPEKFLDNTDDFYYTDEKRIQTNMSGILPDYIPIQMNEKLTPPTSLYLVPGGVEQQIEVLVDRGHQKLFRTRFISDVFMNFMIADFPGWKVEIDGEVLADSEKQKGQDGTFGIDVPAGEHLIGVYFGSTTVRHLSDWASVLSVVILLFLLVQTKEKSTVKI